MHDKFIFSFIYRAYYPFFILFTFVFISCVFFYINYPDYEKKLKYFLLNEAIHSIDAQSDKVIRRIVDEDQEFIKHNLVDEGLRTQNEMALRQMQYKSISSIFIVFNKGDNFYFLLDTASKDGTGFLEPFRPVKSERFDWVRESKKGRVFLQKTLENIGFTLIKPIIQENRVIAFLLIDYKQKSLEEIFVDLNYWMKSIALALGFFMLFFTLLGIILGRNMYRKYFTYRIPETRAYTRSFLTDNYERINFLDYYVSLIDIDTYRRIVDLHGQDEGRNLIQMVLCEISKHVGSHDLLIQYGGEEFLLLVNKKRSDIVTYKEQMEKIRLAVESLPVYLNRKKEKVTVSVGTLIQSENATSLQSAIQNADTALYFAKHNGCNRVCDFDLSDNKRAYREKLKEMIESDQLVCHYQPIVNLHTGQTHHYEALLRIANDDEIIYPDKILPDLEESYFYSRMSMKVIVFNLIKLREDPSFMVSINLSSDDLLHEEVIDLLVNNADIAYRMQIEILETKNVDYVRIQPVIHHLKVLGYKLCIDDFGSGYANLEHLFNLSIDYLKIDGSLIKNLHTDKRSHSIIRAIVSFCEDQKIEVVAEFVENEQLVDVLKSLGIHLGQGYYFAKPMPYENLESHSSSTR